jgi:hypothetical protein
MIILQIEHKIPDFEIWKKAFESDPINRKKSGVIRYSIFQPVDDPKYIMINLEFNDLKSAEDTLAALQKLWVKVEGKVMMDPKTRIVNKVETIEIF